MVNGIKKDLTDSLKSGDEIRASTLRLLLSEIKNKEKEKRYSLSSGEDINLSDEEVVEIIQSEAKKRRESIKSFKAGSREDLAEKEKKELTVLEEYLPERMSEDEISETIKEAISRTGAESAKDTGKVMAEIMPKVKGRADGSEVSEMVKKMLS